MSSPFYDAVIVGGGPAGAACAGFCAAAGLRVAVVERAVFPRDKVCGDCLNPDAWPVLARLGLEERVRALPHVALRAVEFVGLRGRKIRLPLPDAARGEIAVRRRELDALLLARAAELGATVSQGRAVGALRQTDDGDGFVLTTTGNDEAATVRGRFLVAADGRNSLVARLTGLLPADPVRRTDEARVGLQTHLPCPAGADFGARVQMRWFADGYGGLCPVGGGELNVSLTGPPAALERLKGWVRGEFGAGTEPAWRTIAPLDRAAARRAAVARGNDGGVFLVGDAARVVEPFTGEGIYYALRSGELAAGFIVAAARGQTDAAGAAAGYREAHARMYRGRLWVNRLARAAGRHPRWASWALELLRWQPGLLRLLTAKVVAADRCAPAATPRKARCPPPWRG